MKKCFIFALSFAPMVGVACADSTLWYVSPASQGECGEECYTPPVAWIDTVNERHAFGVSCDSLMIMGGPAMQVSEPTFNEVEMTIDGESFGRFSVQNGLNDVYLVPVGAASTAPQTPANVISALEAGGDLRLTIAGRSPLSFVLAGSKKAIRSMQNLCQR